RESEEVLEQRLELGAADLVCDVQVHRPAFQAVPEPIQSLVFAWHERQGTRRAVVDERPTLDNLSLRPERRDLEVVDQFTERPSARLVCWAPAHGAFPRLESDPLRTPQPLLGLALPAPPLGLPDRPTGADVNPLALIVEVAALVNEVEV